MLIISLVWEKGLAILAICRSRGRLIFGWEGEGDVGLRYYHHVAEQEILDALEKNMGRRFFPVPGREFLAWFKALICKPHDGECSPLKRDRWV